MNVEKPLSLQAFEASISSQLNDLPDIHARLVEADEDLVPELECSVVDGWIKHPLVVSAVGPKALQNFWFLVRRHEIECARKIGDWETFVFTHERAFRIEAFQSVAEEMDDKSYWKVLSEVYVDSENTHYHKGKLRRFLMSDRPHRKSMMSDAEQVAFDGLPEKLTLYRGYRFSNALGWSWTLSKEKAVWFANRFAELRKGVARIATGEVEKDHVIAFLDGRNEKEVICDPRLVRFVSTIRLDGKEDEKRIPRDDKHTFRIDSYSLSLWMQEHPTMLLSEMDVEIGFMKEELDAICCEAGYELLCGEVDTQIVDSQLLVRELRKSPDVEVACLFDLADEASFDVAELIEKYGDSLCGDFRVNDTFQTSY